jgi:hypothetical protein
MTPALSNRLTFVGSFRLDGPATLRPGDVLKMTDERRAEIYVFLDDLNAEEFEYALRLVNVHLKGIEMVEQICKQRRAFAGISSMIH